MVFTPVTELFLNGAWTPITSDVRQSDGISITRGRSAEAESADPSSCSLTIDNTSGNYSPRNPVGAHFGQLGRNTPLRVLSPSAAANYVALPGDFASYASTPDVAALDVTGDVDIRVDVDLQTWRPPNQYGLVRKWVDAGAQGSWTLDLRASGLLRFFWSATGSFSASLNAESTVAIPSSSTRLAVRATLDVNNGAAGRDIRFYTSTTGVDGTWTQLGATVTQAGTTSIFNSTAPVEVGRTVDGSSAEGDIPSAVQGRVYGFQMRSGIGGTVVANADFTAQDTGISGFTDSAGRVWALNGSAVMVNPDARFHGELAALPSRWDKTGRDRYVPVEASGILRRLGQGQTALKSVMYRSLTTWPGIVAYWPCEDGSGSTELASGVPGYPTMHLWGDVDTASFDGFVASEALPTASGVQWWGAVPPYSITGLTQVSFLLAVPAGGVASISQVCGIRTSGSALRWEVHVNPAGDMRLQSFNSEDVQIADSGYVSSFAANGRLLHVVVRLNHTGADVNWSLNATAVGSTTLVTTLGTLVGRTIGRIRWITMNVGGVLTDTALGHIAVQNDFQSMGGFQLGAYAGELATDRILRLCQDDGLPVTIVGDVTDAALLGPQRPGHLLDLLQEAAATDLGILYEPRGHLGLGYRTRASLYAQDATLTLDYSAETLSGIEPVEDDDAVRNDVTVKRVDGSSARAELTSGPLSVQAPPDGVGRYDEEVEISLSRDDDLPDQASWRLHLGTVDEARYPLLGVNLANAAFTAGLTADAVALDVGDRIVVTDLPAGLGAPDDVQQIAQGFTETITPFEWLIGVNCTPASPWDVGRWDDSEGPGEARYSPDSSVTNSAITATATRFGTLTAPTRAADGSLSEWQTALATATQQKVLVVGDSISEGTGTTDVSLRWQTILNARLRPGGALFPFIPAWPNTSATGFPVTRSGMVRRTNALATRWGLGWRTAEIYDDGSGSAGTVTFTFNGNKAEVMFGRASSTGVMTVVVDGGAPTNVDTNSAAAGGVTDLGAIYSTGTLSSGAHTVVITRSATSAAGQNVWLQGLLTYRGGDATSGVRVLDGARHGIATTFFTDDPGRLTALAGTTGGIRGALQGAGGADLVIYGLGTNDMGSAVAPATFRANTEAFIAALRDATATPTFTGSILLVGMYLGGGRSPSVWQTYHDQLVAIAEADPDIGYLDLRDRMPAVDDDTEGLYADSLHPSDLGHARMADIISDYLALPSWGGDDVPYDIAIGGERMTVTSVDGPMLTVTRSVNGVVKAHATGSDVGLFKPARYAL